MRQPIYSARKGRTARKRCDAGTANGNRHLESWGLGLQRRRDILLKRPPFFPPFYPWRPIHSAAPRFCLSPNFLGFRRPVFKAVLILACPPVFQVRWMQCGLQSGFSLATAKICLWNLFAEIWQPMFTFEWKKIWMLNEFIMFVKKTFWKAQVEYTVNNCFECRMLYKESLNCELKNTKS